MARTKMFAAATLTAILIGGVVLADVKSGPKVGDSVGAFNPTHVTGKNAGKSNCLVWSNGGKPVVAIFARQIDANLASLVKKVDESNGKEKGMGSFVIFLDKGDDMEKKIKEFADKEGIKTTVLAMDNPAGPDGYNIAKDADVTVLLYKGHKVVHNYAFEKGKLSKDDVEKIAKEIPGLLGK